MSAAELLPGAGDILLLCDHASAAVPQDIDLRIDLSLLGLHIAVDLGAGALTHALAARLGAPAVLGTVSRLVIDLHREPDHPALVPETSDGHAIPGNVGADRWARIAHFQAPYHRAVAAAVRRSRPALIVAIHSYTRQLEAGGEPRAIDAGILYNRDDRAAHLMIDGLRSAGIATGDNAPYSGRMLNATLNRHGEANGIACVSIEVCNDLLADDAGVSRWSVLLAPIIESARNRVAKSGAPTQ
ncbi:N-formylglutamate amidohydrolase [Sphingomonas baiyangensis]|uniref:N-formylglutamate amidohydrolase n=1 Tax=Sphingomonas baiyangensis TaxID=2572576 RepID=A0A4U1L3V2_9SPHN|nr:N-formylglutamate amidohydrolase [Sphingomonas baiyangensis]TKD50806.1 N-formylglutamate amidohydrolase [Sphingomonas baiyangensis]